MLDILGMTTVTLGTLLMIVDCQIRRKAPIQAVRSTSFLHLCVTLSIVCHKNERD